TPLGVSSLASLAPWRFVSLCSAPAPVTPGGVRHSPFSPPGVRRKTGEGRSGHGPPFPSTFPIRSGQGMMPTDLLTALDRDGFVLVPGVLPPAEVSAARAALASALAGPAAGGPGIRAGDGTLYAARNVLELWPGADDAWRRP